MFEVDVGLIVIAGKSEVIVTKENVVPTFRVLGKSVEEKAWDFLFELTGISKSWCGHLALVGIQSTSRKLTVFYKLLVPEKVELSKDYKFISFEDFVVNNSEINLMWLW